MTFTIGRGNDIVCAAVEKVAERLVGRKTEELFADMGAAWNYLLADPQLRWIGPEKGVIHIATGAVVNALWDSELVVSRFLIGAESKLTLLCLSLPPATLPSSTASIFYFIVYARHERKPLWQLIADFTPEEFVRSVAFRYITDAISPAEALELLKSKEAGKKERLERVKKEGYPSYTTSVVSHELRRTREWEADSLFPRDRDGSATPMRRSLVSLARPSHKGSSTLCFSRTHSLTPLFRHSFNHFKVKVGGGVEDDRRRLALVRSIIDDPKECAGRPTPAPETLVGKNAGPTGSVLMIDANQVRFE
jgi:L-fuconate dehydratase